MKCMECRFNNGKECLKHDIVIEREKDSCEFGEYAVWREGEMKCKDILDMLTVGAVIWWSIRVMDEFERY